MPGGEVLPVVSLSEHCPEFVVADPTAAPWRPNSRLLDRTHPRADCCWLGHAAASKAELVAAHEDANYAGVVRRARGAAEHDPLLSTRVENGPLTDGGKEDERLDPKRCAG